MQLAKFVSAVALVTLLGSAAQAQQVRSAWIADAKSGCRLWDLSPRAGESAQWSGACVNGFAQGRGTVTWYVDGFLVETDDGEFSAGKLNGHVVLSFTDGQHFDGQFRDHKPNGPGTLQSANGETWSGNWIEGCLLQGKRRMNFGVDAQECKLVSDVAKPVRLAER